MRKNFLPKVYLSVAEVLLVRKSFALKAYLSIAEVFQMRKNFLAKRGPFSELQNRSLAEGVGFEPTIPVKVWRFSRPLH